MLPYKFTSSRAGVPDRLFLTPDGGIFFIEMKAPNGKLSKLQENEHRIIRRQGHIVYVCWDLLEAKHVFDKHAK